MSDEEEIEEMDSMLSAGVTMLANFINKGGFKPMAKALKTVHTDLIDAGFNEDQATAIVAHWSMSGK
jgi:hypothetical protein